LLGPGTMDKKSKLEVLAAKRREEEEEEKV
jgi:hypothetical protein